MAFWLSLHHLRQLPSLFALIVVTFSADVIKGPNQLIYNKEDYPGESGRLDSSQLEGFKDRAEIPLEEKKPSHEEDSVSLWLWVHQ